MPTHQTETGEVKVPDQRFPTTLPLSIWIVWVDYKKSFDLYVSMMNILVYVYMIQQYSQKHADIWRVLIMIQELLTI